MIAEEIQQKERRHIEKRSSGRWVYAIPVLIILLGLASSAWIWDSAGLGKYPAMIKKVYAEERHYLIVPGSREIRLTRTGAYGVYYEYTSELYMGDYPVTPPALECSLTSKSTGATRQAAPDYVEGNRYSDQDRTGILIMSLTVDQPDTYIFACRYRDGVNEPKRTVALGPNYGWEFLRVAWKISLPLLGGLASICGSVLIGLVMVVVIAIKRQG
jgi:hypothetical protein